MPNIRSLCSAPFFSVLSSLIRFLFSESTFHTVHSSRRSGCVSSAHTVGVKCRGSNFTNKKEKKKPISAFKNIVSRTIYLKFSLSIETVPLRCGSGDRVQLCQTKNNLWCSFGKTKSEMDPNKWEEELFHDKSWPHVDREFKKDFDTIERVFFIFFGIILAIVICVFILVIFMICYRLCKGDRNQLYRRPFYNVPTARPTLACNTIWYIPSNFILFASGQRSYHKY